MNDLTYYCIGCAKYVDANLFNFTAKGRRKVLCSICRPPKTKKVNKYRRVKDRQILRDKIFSDYNNKCSKCGYNKTNYALVFHHVNPKDKLHTIGDLLKEGTEEEIYTELKKCMLVCYNCHIEIHKGVK